MSFERMKGCYAGCYSHYSTDTCCICLQNLCDRNRVILECGHNFHFSCIFRIENRRCPLCRQRYSKDVPLSFHQLFSKAVVLIDTMRIAVSPSERLAIVHELLDTLLTILEVHENETILLEKLKTMIPKLKKEFSTIGYSESRFENYEKRLKRLL